MTRRRQKVCMLAMLVFSVSAAWAQDVTGLPDGTTSKESQQQPAPAYGQEGAPPPIVENPPLSSIDLPALGPHATPESYLQPGVTVSESATTNIGNTLGGSTNGSISRGLGSLALRRLWGRYDLAADYLGGVAYYAIRGVGLKQLQDLGVNQKVTWKRGQLSLRDSFSYLPDGNFGGTAFGSMGSEAATSIGNTAFGSFWGGTALGILGVTPRMLNVSLADVTENLTPKSAVTAAGGYAFTHFYGNNYNGSAFIGSSQISAQGGYDRILTRHTQVGLVYGYQGFDFSVLGTAFHSHIVQGMYGHRISGRMDLLVGAGPQITFVNTHSAVCSDPVVPLILCQATGNTLSTAVVTNRILGVAGQARVRYRFPRTSLDFRFERFETSGGGVFAGAQSNIGRLTAERPLSRVWNASVDIGYADNSRLQPLTVAQVTSCASQQTSQTACPANNANTYRYGFAGLAVHRHFGRNIHAFLSYQTNELSFDRSFCTANVPCNRISNRQVVIVGLDWIPRPIRLD